MPFFVGGDRIDRCSRIKSSGGGDELGGMVDQVSQLVPPVAVVDATWAEDLVVTTTEGTVDPRLGCSMPFMPGGELFGEAAPCRLATPGWWGWAEGLPQPGFDEGILDGGRDPLGAGDLVRVIEVPDGGGEPVPFGFGGVHGPCPLVDRVLFDGDVAASSAETPPRRFEVVIRDLPCCVRCGDGGIVLPSPSPLVGSLERSARVADLLLGVPQLLLTAV